jgi:hypothetical protein
MEQLQAELRAVQGLGWHDNDHWNDDVAGSGTSAIFTTSIRRYRPLWLTITVQYVKYDDSD